MPLILPNPRHWLRRLLARAAFQRGLRLDAVFQADSVALTKDMVRNGLGCTILPGVAVRDETARGALVCRPIAQPALLTTHATATRRDAAPVVRDIAQVVGEVIVPWRKAGLRRAYRSSRHRIGQLAWSLRRRCCPSRGGCRRLSQSEAALN